MYKQRSPVGAISTEKDWSANYVEQLGYGGNAEFTECMRLYLFLHRSAPHALPSPIYCTVLYSLLSLSPSPLIHNNLWSLIVRSSADYGSFIEKYHTLEYSYEYM